MKVGTFYRLPVKALLFSCQKMLASCQSFEIDSTLLASISQEWSRRLYTVKKFEEIVILQGNPVSHVITVLSFT